MLFARSIVPLLLLVGGALAQRAKKPVRAVAEGAQGVQGFDPAPYSSLFRPENLDLTGFFGPNFVHTKQLEGVDVKALYAKYGSPHHHFAFTFPSNAASDANNRFQASVRLRPQDPKGHAPTKQASEEVNQYYAQPPHPYAQPQQAFVASQQQPQQPQQPQYQAHPPSYSRPHAQGPLYAVQPPTLVQAHPHPSHPHPSQHHQLQQVHHQAHPTPAAHFAAAHHAQVAPSAAPQATYPGYAHQAPSPSAPPAYPGHHAHQAVAQFTPQQQQQLQQQLVAKPPKVDLNAVLQSQVLPQLKDAQGIQLLDLSEFYPQKEGQKPMYYQVNPTDDFKSATFTPVDLAALYRQQQQTHQQHLQPQQPAAQQPQKAIPAAAIREPTLSIEELTAFVEQQRQLHQHLHPLHQQQQQQQQQETQPQQQHGAVAFHPGAGFGGTRAKQPASFAYVSSQSAGGPLRQQQLDLNAYYAQAQRPDAHANHPGGQYAVHDVPKKPKRPVVHYAPQSSEEASEEAAPSISPASHSQSFKATVAKAVKRGPKPTQLAHIASPLPASPTPNPTAPSKPSKIRQLVKKPHVHGPGYSFELTG